MLTTTRQGSSGPSQPVFSLTQPAVQCTATVHLDHGGGLDAALAARLVETVRPFVADCRIGAATGSANARSLVELLMLQLGCGACLTVAAFGPDARELIQHVDQVLAAPRLAKTG